MNPTACRGSMTFRVLRQYQNVESLLCHQCAKIVRMAFKSRYKHLGRLLQKSQFAQTVKKEGRPPKDDHPPKI